MEETETPHPDYVTGFNEGYVIARDMPELAKDLEKSLGESLRSQGFRNGAKHYDQEKVKSFYPSYLRSDRFSALDSMTDYTMDKEMEKDIDEPDKD